MIGTWLFAGLFLGFLGRAAHGDIVDLRIPNRLTLTMAATGPLAVWLLGPGGGALPAAFLTGAITLVVSWTLFELGLLGGGDAKLLTASALWLGPEATLAFAVATALFGGVLAAGLLILGRSMAVRSLVGPRWQARLGAEAVPIPYAAAMAPAGAVTMLTTVAQPW